jgi:trk system potassium uptake protein TrkH
MCWFDAVCHAMATVSTGGFSTRDESLGAFPNPSTWWVATLSIIAGSIPITFWIRLFQRGWRVKLDSQILVYLFLLAVCSIVMTFCALRATSLSFWIAFSHAAVNVTSIVSNCGLVSTDYSRWGNFAAACFFFFCFVGGCTGSTTGSIKIYRWQILYLALRNQFLLMVQPHRTIVTIYGSKQVSGNVMPSVISFFAAYVLCFALCSVVLSAFDLDFITSTSAAASSLAGAGPGLGQLIGPGHNYALLPDGAKLVLCLAMLLGRLEIFTLLVILMPTFWRD